MKVSTEKSLNRMKPKSRVSNLVESRNVIKHSGIFSQNERESEFFYDVSEVASLPRDSLKPAKWTRSKSTKSTMSQTLDLGAKTRSPSKPSQFKKGENRLCETYDVANLQKAGLNSFVDGHQECRLKDTPQQPKNEEDNTNKKTNQGDSDDHIEYLPTYSENRSLRYSYSDEEKEEPRKEQESAERIQKIEEQLMKMADNVSDDQEIIDEYNLLGNSAKRDSPEDELLRDLMIEDDAIPVSSKKRRSTKRSIDESDSFPEFLSHF